MALALCDKKINFENVPHVLEKTMRNIGNAFNVEQVELHSQLCKTMAVAMLWNVSVLLRSPRDLGLNCCRL